MLSLTSILSRAAILGGAEPSVIDDDFELTWEDFQTRVKRSAGILTGLGIKPGDRVALLMNNSVRLLELMFATVRAGGVFVPVNTRFAAPEIIDCLKDCDARFLFASSGFLQGFGDGALNQTELETIVDCDAPNPTAPFLSYMTLFQAAVEAKDAGRSGEDLAAIFYTSGTTGRAKGVMLTHAGIVTSELQWIAGLGLTQNDCLMIIAPMFHAAGALNAIGATTLGARVVFIGTFNLATMLSAIETYGVTKIGLIVVMLDMIARFPDLETYDLSSVKRISYGGSPITEAVLLQARKTFANAEFYQIYGQTEGGPTISILPPEYHDPQSDKIRSAGAAVIGSEIRIADPEGKFLPVGETGEVCVKGPGVSPGYWNLQTETQKSRIGEWLKTGDAGYIDKDGYLFICDRIKDMVITGGENVYPSEVENALMRSEAILECAVIGIPSDKWGEQVHAVIRLKEGAELEEKDVLAHCRKWLAGYKIPKSVEFRVEPLPVSASAKILKSELRKPYWQNRVSQI